MHLLTVIGARPQFIKAAPVSQALAAAGIRETLLHTGQHYDPAMSDVFFEELGIPAPAYNLGLGGGTHGKMTAGMLAGIEEVLLNLHPTALLVYGDTNSTLAGALAAAKLHLPVIHVEAGLRSFNRKMPEEVNRVLTDHLSSLLLCSSEVGVNHLRNEGITRGVHIVGDVMADSLLAAQQRILSTGMVTRLQKLGLEFQPKAYGLLTLHRAENTDDRERLATLVEALNNAPFPLVFPIHPRTAGALQRHGLAFGPQVKTIPPVGYLDMAALLAGAKMVLTDSGGLQKEAYWSRIPCVTLRDETEWTETCETGWNHVVGADAAQIARCLAGFSAPADHLPLYGGDGKASQRIATIITQSLPPAT